MTGRLLTAAAVLTAVAAVASNTTPALSWALLPAAALTSIGLLARPGFAADGAPRHAATVLAATLGGMLALTLIGAALTASSGLEPTWLAQATMLAAAAAGIATTVLGMVIVTSGGPRAAGTLLAVSLPVGLGFDAVVSAVLPVGLFVEGATIALLLLAVALLLLGRNGRVASATARPASA